MGEGERRNFCYFITNIIKAILFFSFIIRRKDRFFTLVFQLYLLFFIFQITIMGGGSRGIVAHFKVANSAKGWGDIKSIFKLP